MSDYIKDLINRANDNTKWPSFDRPSFLGELNELANNALEKDILEGYLAALLIYHQLCEEIIRVLIADAHFFIQLSVFPNEINFPQKKNPMFGQVLDELRTTVSFQGKDELIKKCEEMNKLRIEIVHQLTRQNSLKDIKSRLGKVRKLFDEIFELHEVAHDDWYITFHNFKKDIEWDEYLK